MKITNIELIEEPVDTWDIEVEDVHEYILSNGIISHNTSGKAINATESIEPIVDLFFMNEGTQTLPSLVKDIKECREYYVRCWETDNKFLLYLNAIRQMYIDQSQSINLYYINPDSAKVLWEDIEYAMEMGVKTLYYMKTPKAGFELEEKCESCT